MKTCLIEDYWSDEETKVLLDIIHKIKIHLCFDRKQQRDTDVYKDLRGEMFTKAAARSALPGILVSANLVSSLKSAAPPVCNLANFLKTINSPNTPSILGVLN